MFDCVKLYQFMQVEHSDAEPAGTHLILGGGGGGGRGKAKAKPVFKNTVRAGLYRLLFVSGSRSNLIEIIYCFFIF